MKSWRVIDELGKASEFHSNPMEYVDFPTARFISVTQSAIVLGSSQPSDQVSPSELRELGAELVVRRSGGGAVFLSPAGQLWVDLAIPRSDPLFDEDVSRSFLALSEAFVGLLEGIGIRDIEVHTGRLVGGQLARTVCFAGLGPGEITFEGAKVVGMSQRRTARGAVIQCTVYLRYPYDQLHSILNGSDIDTLLPGYALGVAEISDSMADLDPLAALARMRNQLLAALESL